MSGPERTVMFQLPSMLAGKLACVAGTLAGRSWELSAGTFVIGRNDNSDLPLTVEPGVSKVHCKIVAEGEHYLLVDCESRNGTIVNGAPVQRVKLRDGDEVRICGCVLRFSQTGGDTQVRVKNADASYQVGEPAEPMPPEPVPAATRPEPPMLLPSDALSVVEPSAPSEPTVPTAPRRSRGRTLLAWYASGLAGSLLFGGTASAVIFVGGTPPEQVAALEDKPADHPAADKPADQPAAKVDEPAGAAPAADTKPPDADAHQPEVPALDPAAVKSVAEADKPPADKPAEEPAAAKPEEAKAPVEEPKAAPAAEPAPPRDEERARRRVRREETAAEPAAEPAAEGGTKVFAAAVEGGKSETLKTRGGKVKSVEAADGDTVERGKVLVTFDAGGNEDELNTLKERIASLEGIDDDDARRELKDARQRYEALQAASKSVPVVAGSSGKLTGFAVAVGDVLKNNQVVGRIAESGAAKKVRVTVDRATKVKRGARAVLGLRGGGEGEGTVASTSGRTVIVDTGDHAAEDVETVHF
ncbi:MAG: FHA domain-containing protein [Deltaproteobacteria bacterium]|nr:FHA domain-containing protein [Deltaproteobacteria bacterium]